jgi:DNA-binding MarR family transcriptional regulator
LKKSIDSKERATTYYLHGLSGEILQLLAQHFQGQTTLNHLRIGSYIGYLTLYRSKGTSNKEISEELNIPPSTVSRIVNDFIDEKWVVERPHPEDGRKKLLSIAKGHELEDGFERSFRTILNELLRRYDDGRIVRVCASKKSY